MIQSRRSSASFAASGAFLSVALIAIVAAGAVAGGEAGHSQLRLASATIETMTALQDVCSTKPVCANPQLQQPAVSRVC